MLRRLAVAAWLLLALAGCSGTAASGAASAGSSAAPSAGGPSPRLNGTVTAGPVCPVERVPPDPSCAPRPVAGAVIVVSAGGAEIARTTTAVDGTYQLAIGQTGTFTVTPQPVKGYLGTPAPVTVAMDGPGLVQTVDFSYDTGIR